MEERSDATRTVRSNWFLWTILPKVRGSINSTTWLRQKALFPLADNRGNSFCPLLKITDAQGILSKKVQRLGQLFTRSRSAHFNSMRKITWGEAIRSWIFNSHKSTASVRNHIQYFFDGTNSNQLELYAKTGRIMTHLLGLTPANSTLHDGLPSQSLHRCTS